ncbi:MAG: hypothetical protein HOW73_01015 [Polyangiaceae bacterium]|nr:hypothetical protein [Polyangiaceae bacterium]
MNKRLMVALAALALPLWLQGCGASISDDADGNDDECGPAPGEAAGCGFDWMCVDGSWELVEVPTFAPCVECPASQPADGSACEEIGQECQYEVEYGCDDFPETITSQCTENGWMSFWPRCQPEPECPDTPPQAGTDCTGWDFAYYCSYEVDCGELGLLDMHCDFSTTPPLWVVDGGSDCVPTDCSAVTDAGVCNTTGGCQWLVPGCANDGQISITEGCYPVDDCLVTNECGPEEICVPEIYDPCIDGGCGACGIEYHVCEPAKLGG